jgi:probable HAF family extracellular repeat protein
MKLAPNQALTGAAFTFISMLCLPPLTVSSQTILYTVKDLGTLGGSYVSVSGINNRGEVVGNSTTNGTSVMHACVYSGGALIDLGTLGGTNSYGYGINDNGQTVGAAYTAAGQDDAFLWDTGTMSDLGSLGGNGSQARAINNAGQIAGSAWIAGNTEFHAFLRVGSTNTDLGTLGGTRSEAWAINASGQVAGRASVSGISSWHAFLYSGGVMNDLGTFGGSLSWAYGINNAGQVVGGAYVTSGVEHAFLYNSNMNDLTPSPAIISRAYGINNLGQVVGFVSSTNTGAQHAFVYSGGTMTDLNNVIDTNSGWTLDIAMGINDGGQIIGVGGFGTNASRAFLLTPVPVLQISLTPSNAVAIQFTAQANTGYVFEYRDSLSSGTWQTLVVLDPITTVHDVTFTDPLVPGRSARFYRVTGS